MKTPLFAAACLAMLFAHADVVTFASGDRLTGKLKSISGDVVEFESDVAGAVKLDAAKIASITTEGDSDILYNDETRERLHLDIKDGKYRELDAAGSEVRTIDKASIKQVNPEAERWHGSVNVSGSLTRGNTVSESVTVLADLSRRWESDRFTANGGYYFAQSGSSRDNKQKTDDRILASAQEDHFWAKKVYSYVNGKFERDRIQDLDHRYRAGTGMGYQWFEGNVFENVGKLTFSQEAGIEYVNERYSNTDNGASDSFASFRYAHHLKWVPGFVKRNVEAFHNLEYHPDTSNWANEYVINADVGVSTTVFAGWTLLAKIEWDYDSAPAEHAKKSDMRYIVGLGYKW